MKPRNLVICFTPLHVLIVKRIIKEVGIDDMFLIYFYQTDNKKNRHYFDELSINSEKSFFIQKKSNIFYTLYILIRLFFLLRYRLGKDLNFITGNLKTIYSRFLGSVLCPKNILTFDDGIGNICDEGYFYVPNKFTGVELVLRMFGFDFSYKTLYDKIQKHYTIYSSKNAIHRTEKIRLFDQPNEISLGTKERKISILLTSPISEDKILSCHQEKILYSKIVKDYNIDYIISHPLEYEKKIFGVEYIDSERIAEEIIFGLLNKYEHITIYGWYSTVLINLYGVENITRVNYSFKSNYEIVKMDFIIKKYNVETIWIDI